MEKSAAAWQDTSVSPEHRGSSVSGEPSVPPFPNPNFQLHSPSEMREGWPQGYRRNKTEISAGPLNLEFSGMRLAQGQPASGEFLSITGGLGAVVGQLSVLVTPAGFGGDVGGVWRKGRVR